MSLNQLKAAKALGASGTIPQGEPSKTSYKMLEVRWNTSTYRDEIDNPS